jgi:ParB/RepB/Spo0J family partition protein
MRKNRSRNQTAADAPAATVTEDAPAAVTAEPTPVAAEEPASVPEEAAPAAEPTTGEAPAPEQEPAAGAPREGEQEQPAAPAVLQEEAPEVRMFRPDEVVPWPGLNPRTHFDPDQQAELDDSVRRNGVRQPAVVHLREEGSHFLVIGERRWRSCQNTGRMLPAVVGTFSEAEAFELALIENIQRSDLTPIEEARGFRRWLDTHDGGSTYTLAERIGKSQPYIANRLALLRLPAGTQQLVEDELVTATQARDAFVPFAGIPEDVRVKVFDTVQTRVREHYRDNPGEHLNLARLKEAVGRAAVKWSRPLSAADAEHTEERPLFDPRGHDAECGCNGPVWNYRNWGNPQRRCFNAAWWNGKQAEAREAQKRAEEERRAEVERRRAEAEQAGKAGEAPAPPVAAEEARTLYAFTEVLTDSASDFRELRTLLDPEQIPADSLRVVENHEAWRARYSLVCIDRDAVNKAKLSASQTRLDVLRRLTEERNAQERQDAARLDLRHPEVIADLLTALPKVTDYALHWIADQHNIRLPQNGIERTHWLAVGKKELQLFARIVVLRIRAGTFESPRDPVEAEATRRLLEVYGARLEALRAAVQIPGTSPAERMAALVDRFHAVYDPVADAGIIQSGDLSESAGELVQTLQEIVDDMEAVQADALAAGVDPEAVDCSAECALFEALAAAYAARFDGEGEGTTALDEVGQGTPDTDGPPAGEHEPAVETKGAPEGAPVLEVAPAAATEPPADELTTRRRGRQGRGSHGKGNGAAA